jgi:hypothetical protein
MCAQQLVDLPKYTPANPRVVYKYANTKPHNFQRQNSGESPSEPPPAAADLHDGQGSQPSFWSSLIAFGQRIWANDSENLGENWLDEHDSQNEK